MAEAYGKLTGKPGLVFVTRGPGATNAAIGILTAAQDSTSKMPAAQRKRLLAAGDYITRAEPVVQVARDAPVRVSGDTDTLPLVARDPVRVVELAAEYGVTSSIARLQKSLDALPG
jgi:hypothetical protein